MSRWPLFVVPSMWLALGCTHRVQAGLASAPWLGSTGFADERPADVIANGDDACGPLVESASRGARWSFCATEPRRRGVVRWSPTTAGGAARPLAMPWLEHFYVGWPCPPRAPLGDRTLAWSPATPGTCESR